MFCLFLLMERQNLAFFGRNKFEQPQSLHVHWTWTGTLPLQLLVALNHRKWKGIHLYTSIACFQLYFPNEFLHPPPSLKLLLFVNVSQENRSFNTIWYHCLKLILNKFIYLIILFFFYNFHLFSQNFKQLQNNIKHGCFDLLNA